MGNGRNPRKAGGRRRVDVPPSPDQLEPLSSRCAVVQTRDDLDCPEAEAIAKLMATDPEVELRVCGEGTAGDLSFLKRFPELERLRVDDQKTTGLEGLKHAPNLVQLEVTAPSDRLSLKPLRALKSLEEVALDEQDKHLEVLSELPALTDVTLVRAALPEGFELPHAQRVVLVQCKFDGPPRLPCVTNLRLKVSVPDNAAEWISDMSDLEVLGLATARGMDGFPDLSRLPNLHTLLVHRFYCREVIEAVPRAPTLCNLQLSDSKIVLEPEAFEPLCNHPTLERIYVSLRTKTATKKARAVLSEYEHVEGSSDLDPDPRY